MNKLEVHKKLVKLKDSSSDFEIINSNLIETSYSPESFKMIGEANLKNEKIGNSLRIELPHKFRIYNDINSFRHSNKLKADEEILIFTSESPISYIDSNTYINFKLCDSFYLFPNAQSYLKFIDELKELEKDGEDSFHFTDSLNLDTRKLTLVSLAKQSRLTISYQNEIPNFQPERDLTVGFQEFKKCFTKENKNLPLFLKNEIINTVINYEQGERMQKFFENLSAIIYKAKLNFNVFLAGLSLDNIKREYDEIKTKYFKDLSEVLSKLTTGIVALPIAIASLLFAIEKIKEMPVYLYLLITIIIFTSVYIGLLLRVNYSDLGYIKKLFCQEFKILIENDFFSNYQKEKKSFEETKERILKRIGFLKKVIESYYWVVVGSNILIILLILYYLGLSNNTLIFIGLALMFITALFRNQVLINDEKEEQNAT